MVLNEWCALWKTGGRNLFALLRQAVSFCLLVLSSLTLLAEEPKLNLPELGSPNRATFSIQAEDTLSLAFLEMIYSQADLVTDPELNDYVRGIGQRLLRHVRTNRHYQFYLINDHNINAFAGPGGIIALHTGLILAAKTEDEIAAVMAHEIQHVQQEHISRMFDQGKKGMLTTLGSIVGALIVGSQNPQAGMGIMMGGMALNAQQQLAFSRDHEWEADRTGIDVLAAAGYNPNAMADFFDTLFNRYRNDSKVPEILLTHPVSTKRLSDSRARARKLSYQARQEDNSLALAKLRINQLTGKSENNDKLSNELTCYQSYLKLIQSNTPLTASSLCQSLPKHLWSEIIQLQAHKNLKPTAWKSWIEIYPNSSALLLHYADLLLEQQQASAVIALLVPTVARFPESWEFWKRVAQAWNQLNDSAQEAYAMAKAYASIGSLKLGQIQIDRAEKSLTNNHSLALKNDILLLKTWLETQQKARENL
jgi:predicted Zn-dependent protease